MSDSTVYDLASDLTDFLSDAVAGITLPSGCADRGQPIPTRVYTSAGAPDAWNCGEIAVWSNGWGPTNLPNQDVGIDQSACAVGTYVEVNWRVVSCISKSTDGKSPITVTAHEADAECFYTLAFGLYRRIQVNLGVPKADGGIWDGLYCKRITGGRLDLGERSGGMLSAGQAFRIGIDLTHPDDDSS